MPITVLSGFDRVTVDDLATGLLLRTEHLAVVYADPSPAERGYVTVIVSDSDGRTRSRRVDLEHNCASCTLRAATVAALTQLARSGDYDTLALQLHPGIEPDAALRGLLAELPPVARLDSHLSVLSPDWLDILSGGSTLHEHDAAITTDDDRFAATVLCAGIETATTLVVPRSPAPQPAPDTAKPDQERAVLDLLAPAAVRLRLRSVLDVPDDDTLATGRLHADRLDPLVDYGIRDPRRSLEPAGSLTLVRWHARRPLHPLRLHAALDQLADGVIRSSGRLDVADQPDSVVGWDSAGESLLLGPIAPRREHPTHRRSALAFLGDDLDPHHIRATLDDCLVTEDELAILTCSWNDFGDASPGWPATTTPSNEDSSGKGHRVVAPSTTDPAANRVEDRALPGQHETPALGRDRYSDHHQPTRHGDASA